MDAHEILLDPKIKLDLSAGTVVSYYQINNIQHKVWNLLRTFSGLLQPQHFKKYYISKSRGWSEDRKVETKLVNVISVSMLSATVDKLLRLKRTLDAVGCVAEKVEHTSTIPTIEWNKDEQSRSFQYTNGGRPNIKVIILNGKTFSSAWEDWPKEVSSFQL